MSHYTQKYSIQQNVLQNLSQLCFLYLDLGLFENFHYEAQ